MGDAYRQIAPDPNFFTPGHRVPPSEDPDNPSGVTMGDVPTQTVASTLAPVAKSADAGDLKSPGPQGLSRFEASPEHQHEFIDLKFGNAELGGRSTHLTEDELKEVNEIVAKAIIRDLTLEALKVQEHYVKLPRTKSHVSRKVGRSKAVRSVRAEESAPAAQDMQHMPGRDSDSEDPGHGA